MKEKVQDKINRYRELTKSAVKTTAQKSAVTSFSNADSLSKAIRNKEEANIFWAELNTVVKIASSK